jgi:hypothetical protein
MFARSDLGHSRGDGERSAGERDDMIGADLFASLEPVRRDRPPPGGKVDLALPGEADFARATRH